MNTNKNREDIYKIIDIVEEFLKENDYYNELKDEFEYFKLVQISQYILEANNETYFKRAKKELKQINTKNKLIPNEKIETYKTIINSNTLEEYKLKQIEKENTKLENKLKQIEKENTKLLNSNSWKITRPLRNIKNILNK